MGPHEAEVRRTLPGRPAGILYDVDPRVSQCFAGLFNGARQGHLWPNGKLYVGKAECEWDWEQVWPVLRALGLVIYEIRETKHPTGYVSQDFLWSITEKGHTVREDDNQFFRDLMDAMQKDRSETIR